MSQSIQNISLYYASGSSDKEYHAEVKEVTSGFIVTFAYGRRGSTLTTGEKTTKPVSLEAALAIFDKLIREKMAKGYTPGAAGTPYQHTDKDQRRTDVLPQLLNEIDEAALAKLIADDAWCAQEKHDGRRVFVRSDAKGIVGINRSGLTIALPLFLINVAEQVRNHGHFTIDGEFTGDAFHAFDILMDRGVDVCQRSYAERLNLLQLRLQPHALYWVLMRVTPTSLGRQEKQALLDRLRTENREGIVFKRLSAPYTAGRPNSGGDQLKFKFTATATCLVVKTNKGKRSVALRLFQDGMGTGVDVGNVTIPANHVVPKQGEIVEIRYLYAYKGGSLYQPVYLGPRDDVDVSACRMNQLKFKPENNDSDEE